MKWLRSLKKLAEDPSEMCHAPWPENIAVCAFGLLLLVIFGWASVDLWHEADSVEVIPAVFCVIMTLGGLFLFLAGIVEMYLKAIVLPKMKPRHD